jgi:hypothetical protein
VRRRVCGGECEEVGVWRLVCGGGCVEVGVRRLVCGGGCVEVGVWRWMVGGAATVMDGGIFALRKHIGLLAICTHNYS